MKGVIETLLPLLLVPALSFSESSQSSWDDLKQLAAGQQIRIVLNDAKSYEAKFQGVTDEAVVVRLATGDQVFGRHNVLRVSTRGKRHRGRNALIGLAVGAGAGVIIAVASPELGTGKCAQGSCVDAGTISQLGIVGGAVGAGLGAAIPTGAWYDVYRAATKPGK